MSAICYTIRLSLKHIVDGKLIAIVAQAYSYWSAAVCNLAPPPHGARVAISAATRAATSAAVRAATSAAARVATSSTARARRRASSLSPLLSPSLRYGYPCHRFRADSDARVRRRLPPSASRSPPLPTSPLPLPPPLASPPASPLSPRLAHSCFVATRPHLCQLTASNRIVSIPPIASRHQRRRPCHHYLKS